MQPTTDNNDKSKNETTPKTTSSPHPRETLEVDALDELGRNQYVGQPESSAENDVAVDEGRRNVRCDTDSRELLQHDFCPTDVEKKEGAQPVPKTPNKNRPSPK